jgi:alpha-N-arabinofuranosidase
MEELIMRHGAIMDQHDPDKRVALIIDEWGTWYDVEPGTHPRFLYQQNTLRDALVAGIHLNIFNNHCDRVKMTNIAQTVNVLQAMILTEGEKLLLTPTYHVFDMYKVHQGAASLPVEFTPDEYEMDGTVLPQVSVSVSKDASGNIHASLCNLDHRETARIRMELRGFGNAIGAVKGTMLTADDMRLHNTFDRPDALKPQEFSKVAFQNQELTADLPPMSGVVLAIS